MPNRNQYVAQQPNVGTAIERLKWEIATEFGIQLGADVPSRLNGSVGGEMVKRMVAFSESQLSGRQPS